jgi:DNA-binding YbaB/EbfC family protein
VNINPFDLLRNAEAIQKSLNEAQAKLGSIKVTGNAGGGMVEIEMNGRFEMTKVHISPNALIPGADGKVDTGMVEDLVLMAARDAQAKAQAEIAQQMGSLPGMPNIPGMPGNPFGQAGN